MSAQPKLTDPSSPRGVCNTLAKLGNCSALHPWANKLAKDLFDKIYDECNDDSSLHFSLELIATKDFLKDGLKGFLTKRGGLPRYLFADAQKSYTFLEHLWDLEKEVLGIAADYDLTEARC